MTKIKLDARLATAEKFVRRGAVLADVGTDHAYLPIVLCESGKIKSAVASDVNEGPIGRAKKHIKDNGLEGRITTLTADGLRGIEEYRPTDIVIFGMGGELIVRILENAPWVKNKNIRLILQPMTFADALRKFLLESGFEIIDEALSEDDGKIYQTICAEYDGVFRRADDIELLVGKINIERGGELFSKLILQKTEAFIAIKNGKIKGNLDVSYEDTMITKLQSLMRGKQ